MKKLVVTIAVVVLVVILAALIWVTKMSSGFSARAQPTFLEVMAARTARKLAMPTDASGQKNPFTATSEIVSEARAHFADHCATCHANNGSGETQLGKNLYPKAPDMRLPATQNLSDGQLYYIIHNGIRLSGMPAWGEAGDQDQDEDTWKLVHFIRHLPHLTAEEESEMEKLNPKSPEEFKEEQEEERFLNEGHPNDQKSKPRSHHNQ